MSTQPAVIKTKCVDCGVEMTFFAQGMIRCEDCLFKFILGYKDEA